MAVELTRKQREYIEEAEYDHKILHKPMAPCPLVIVDLGNGARTIHCQDANCLSHTIRGL